MTIASVRLTDEDQARLAGENGPVLRMAMELLTRTALNHRATALISISQAHLVGSYHSGPGNLKLLDWLANHNARVVVPTTLNASSEDLLHDTAVGDSADYRNTCRVVDRYRALGCEMTLTCAPYHLERRPVFGEPIAWAESNAVVYANSVIGARTNMTVQYLDLCAALTGRMPAFGYYCDDQRRGQVVYHMDELPGHWLADDAFYQLLGFHVGRDCGHRVPVLNGLPTDVTDDQLRAFGAAAAAAGAVQMFHAVGITPEAPTLAATLHHQCADRSAEVLRTDILNARARLGGEMQGAPNSICLGTPHFSYLEFQQLIAGLDNRRVLPNKTLVVTTSRHTLERLGQQAKQLESLGVTLVADRCCYYQRQLEQVRSPVITNAAKWAYYGPGNLGVSAQFARLTTCIAWAVGLPNDEEAFWHG